MTVYNVIYDGQTYSTGTVDVECFTKVGGVMTMIDNAYATLDEAETAAAEMTQNMIDQLQTQIDALKASQ